MQGCQAALLRSTPRVPKRPAPRPQRPARMRTAGTPRGPTHAQHVASPPLHACHKGEGKAASSLMHAGLPSSAPAKFTSSAEGASRTKRREARSYECCTRA
eukprot:4334817-Alexandrium_andersonii.AAC.1